MADKLKAKPAPAFNADAYVKAIRDVNRAKEKATEENGRAGQATKTACDQYNFDKKAFTFIAGLSKKEPTQQLATLGGIIMGAQAMGMFAQADMFNDFVPVLRAILEQIEAGAPAPKPQGDSAVGRILQPVN